MVNYSCSKCNKTFNKKSNYYNHLYKRKTPCNSISQKTDIYDLKNPTQINSNLTCSECNNIYSSTSNLNRHINKFHPSKIDQSCDLNVPLSHTTPIYALDNQDNYYNSSDYNSTLPKYSQNPTYLHTKSLSSTQITHNYQCQYCFTNYSRKDSLKRHINNNCKIKKINEENELNNNKIILNMQEKIDQLVSKLDIEQEKETHITNGDINCNNNTINNNTTNNVQNINILAFGKENIEYIDDKTVKMLLGCGFESVPQYIKRLHFNEPHPENHNIYISNERDNYVKKFTGKRWVNVDREDMIHELYIDGRDYLVDKYDELKDDLKKATITKFGRFKHNAKIEDIDTIKKNKKEIKRLLYNFRDIPLKTRKNLDEDNV